jgi:hypothetical protein
MERARIALGPTVLVFINAGDHSYGEIEVNGLSFKISSDTATYRQMLVIFRAKYPEYMKGIKDAPPKNREYFDTDRIAEDMYRDIISAIHTLRDECSSDSKFFDVVDGMYFAAMIMEVISKYRRS